MSIFSDLTTEVYQILKSYDKTIILYDSNGNEIYKPSDATRMFVEPENMMLTFIDGTDDEFDNQQSEVRVYISNTVDFDKILKLLTTLRHTISRFGFILTIKKYGKKITPRDFAYGNITEGKMYGTKDKSYQEIGKIKIVVEHTSEIDPTIHGSRSRKVKSLYLENSDTNERFKLNSTSLSIARAMARHMNNGGIINDKIGSFLESISEEMNAIKKFKSLGKKLLKTTPNRLIERILINSDKRLNEIRNSISIINSSRAYKNYYQVFETNSIFEYKTDKTFDDIQNIISEDISFIEPYFPNISGYRLSELPVIKSIDIMDLYYDIVSLTRFKKYIDFEIDNRNNLIKFFSPECFSDALSLCEKFDIGYELETITEEDDMEDDDFGDSFKREFPTKTIRDYVLKNIKDDFSYGENEVKPDGELGISFRSKDIENELSDYISHLVNIDDVSDTTTTATMDNDMNIFEWIKSYDPDIFLSENEDIPGFSKVENAIHNSPKFFNLNEFIKLVRREFPDGYGDEYVQEEILDSLQDYLFDKVLDKNPGLSQYHIEPSMFHDIAKGLFLRSVLPYLTDDKLTESVVSILDNIDMGNLKPTNNNYRDFFVEYISSKLKETFDEDKLVSIIEGYKSILEPIYNSLLEDDDLVDDPRDKKIKANMARKYHDIKPGTRVITPHGKAKIMRKESVKLARRTVHGWTVEYDDGEQEFVTDKDVVPMSDASWMMDKPKYANNFGVNDDRTVTNAYVNEDDESSEELTIEDLANEFMDNENYGGLIKKAFGKTKVIDKDYLEDRVIAFLIKNISDVEPEDIEDLTNSILNILSPEGYQLDEVEKVDTNYQSSIIDDISSDRINNPHKNAGGTIDTDQVDQLTRLKALAGLSRN